VSLYGKPTAAPAAPASLLDMGTQVLSLRMDSRLFERLRAQAERRGMSVQDYVIQALIREDFDERFKAAVEETERISGWGVG
jgi:predicted HicB family RNase H-like nuclease